VPLLGQALDQWRAFRNKLLASPEFQRFAVAFPLFRPVSRARSRQLFDLLAGFTYSQVLYATVKLGLIENLKIEPLAIPAIAARIGWNDGRYTLGIHGAALAGNPWIAKFIEHHHLLYRDLSDPLPLLRGDVKETELQGFWGYAKNDAPDSVAQSNAAAYTALMAASQEAVAAEILAAYDFGQHSHLIDVGGSNGTFIAAAARKHDQLKLTLFDLPAVAHIAREKLNAAGLSRRVTVAGGSFLTDSLPEGPDVATLIRIAHDHDDPSVLAVMTAIRRILPAHGRLIVAEPLSGMPAIAPVADAYFGLYFTAMGQGKTRTVEEIRKLGQAAGFASARAVKTRMPLVTGLVQLNVS
jgi:demethylspheroidene O-methyltransferase